MSSIVITFDPVDGPAVVAEAITAGLAQAFPTGGWALAADDDLLSAGAALERLGRLVDARRTEWAGEVGERSRRELGSASLAARKGCRSPGELVQRVTRVSAATATRRLRLGADTRRQRSLVGVKFPARFPLVAAALNRGDLGVDSARAITTGLGPSLDHIALDDLVAAETELVAAATGTSPEHPIPATADQTTVQATQWKAFLDPDGVRPTEDRAMAQRSFSRGIPRGGLLSALTRCSRRSPGNWPG